MRLPSFAVGLALAAFVSCKPPPETLTVKIGSQAVPVAIGDDWKSTQDKIISMIRPEWEGLSSGNSNSFRFMRVVPDGETERRVGKRAGEGVKVTATTTYGSPEWRFFRNREGVSGIEEMNYDGQAHPMMSGASLEWSRLEPYLREVLITPDRVEKFHGEHVVGGNGG
jgi:hypothetical protein